MTIGRRQLLTGGGAALLLTALQGCGARLARHPAASARGGRLELPPLRAAVDRITRITVCTRPFRAAGPRLDVERIGDQTIVHNYGHGGSGWSLSWGSSRIAVNHALAAGPGPVGVIGCGALGLTSALLAQRAGVQVTIYARELPPDVRSSLATGVWSPDSRICLQERATPQFKRTWEQMTRDSFQTYQTLLGLPGDPVEFIDSYGVRDASDASARRAETDDRPPFAQLQRELIDDLVPAPESFAPGSHSLGQRFLRRNTFMMFNLTSYARLLMSDFLANGGRIKVTEFHSAGEFARLPERTLINATGYGARALLDDQSIVPVRGQIARTIVQPGIRYGLFYRDVSFVPRRDGLVFQVLGASDYYGYGDDSTTPDRAEAEHAVNTIAGLFA